MKERNEGMKCREISDHEKEEEVGERQGILLVQILILSLLLPL